MADKMQTFSLRLPADLFDALTTEADLLGRSLNKYCQELLSDRDAARMALALRVRSGADALAGGTPAKPARVAVPAAAVADGLKHCNKCGKDKPASEFYPGKTAKGTPILRQPCKQCQYDAKHQPKD